MPKISILVPTRGRRGFLKSLIVSLENTIADLNSIELLIAYDKDDIMTIRDLNGIGVKNKPYSFYGRERSDYLNTHYYNWLAKEASGNYLFAVGDDIRFLTKNWNKLLEDKIEEYLKDKPDRIVYISVNEEGSKAKHPCFPLITKEAFQVLGEYHCSELLSWGSDRILWEIYSGIGRTLHIPEISIKHLSYHDGSAPFDETAKSMKERFFRNPNAHNFVSENIVPKQIEKLKKYIEEFNKNA